MSSLSVCNTFTLSALLSSLFSSNAYLDPGSGSFLLQLLLATLLGSLLLIRSSWGKIKDFFTKIFSSSKDEEE